MTKPTDSKVTAAFQAMLAFLQYVLTGRYGGVYTLATRYGVDAAMSLLVVGDRATLLALRDLVQAADDEHAGSASPAAPSPAWLRGEALHPDVVAAAPSASHIGVDPGLRGSGRTVTQVREPAFDRLDAAVDVLRDTSPGWARTVIEAFDAYAESRATLTGAASTAETLTFTRLEGETPEAFRARIALHLNGMGSTPFVLPGQGRNREALGQIVHGVRRQWAAENHHGTSDWTDLADFERERDCRIGVALATVGQGYAGAIDAPVLAEEHAFEERLEAVCDVIEHLAKGSDVAHALEEVACSGHDTADLSALAARLAARPVLTEEAAQKWTGEVVNAFKDGHDERDEAIAEALLAASRGDYPTT